MYDEKHVNTNTTDTNICVPGAIQIDERCDPEINIDYEELDRISDEHGTGYQRMKDKRTDH